VSPFILSSKSKWLHSKKACSLLSDWDEGGGPVHIILNHRTDLGS